MLTQEEALRMFRHDPETGKLYWASPGRRIKVGAEAATMNSKGYLLVGCFRKRYLVHRVIWLMYFGQIPEGMMVDHVDRCRTNNRIENLRLATATESTKNRGKQTGAVFKGVSRNHKRFSAGLYAPRYVYLGTFDTAVEAAQAYDSAALAHFGSFANTNAMMGLL